MKILVCGGRDYSDQDKVNEVLDYLKPTAVVHGAATGADTLAAHWCKRMKTKQYPYPADWDRFGNAAGPMRNIKMLEIHPDIKLVVAFPGGRGTENMILQAQSRKIKIMRVRPDSDKRRFIPVKLEDL